MTTPTTTSLACLRNGGLQPPPTQLGSRFLGQLNLKKAALCHGQTESKVGDRATAPANKEAQRLTLLVDA